MLKKFIETGKIVGTHGLHGELRVSPWCDSPQFLQKFRTLYLNGGETPVHIASSRVHKEQLLIQLEGVDTIEKADQLRNELLFLDRDEVKLPEGRYFMQDLIGLDVYDADTFIYYGILTEVMQTGANDVYEVTAQDKKTYLIPAVPSVVLKIDMEKQKVLIRPVKGIFDDAD